VLGAGSLEQKDALKLVHMYAEKESPKFEKAAMKWLRRYLDELTHAQELREGRPQSRAAFAGRF
jgi:hypothetical protein